MIQPGITFISTGQSGKAKTGQSGPPGPPGPPGKDGKDGLVGKDGKPGASTKGIVWKGVYSNVQIYLPGDAVSYSGSSYVCVKEAEKDKSPLFLDYWDLLAAAGKRGAGGASGGLGPKGDPGSGGNGGTDFGAVMRLISIGI